MLVGQTLRRERMKRELVDMRESIFLLQACPLEVRIRPRVVGVVRCHIQVLPGPAC